MNNADAGTQSGPENITAHPLVRSYLHDLDQSLTGAEDHADVLNAVAEHLVQAAAALPGKPTTAQVQDILAGLGPVERIAAAGTPSPASGPSDTGPGPAVERPAGAWLATPSGLVALVALVLSIILLPLFFPLAGLAFVLGIVALVRRRPRPVGAWVVSIISGVLLLVVLAVGILASIFLVATTEEVTPSGPAPAVTSMPAQQP